MMYARILINTILLAAGILLSTQVADLNGQEPVREVSTVESKVATSGLDTALDTIAPGIKKWATVCVIDRKAEGNYEFRWHDYRDTGERTDFWPASTIKLYTAVAALELLQEREFPIDSIVQFEHRDDGGTWVLDCARSVREMLSEVFRRSSNEDYTLLLRLVGIDRINTEFLVPERGFPRSALMRGYVLERPYRYVLKEPQRITLRSHDGAKTLTFEHTWSGRFYAEERGCTIIDSKTGNITSPRELAECLRRVLFHEQLPEAERYRLSPEQLEFLRHGGNGLVGLETRNDASGPYAWKNAAEAIFPTARFFHKTGLISNYALDVAAVTDAKSGTQFILVPVINAGSDTTPEKGGPLVSKMSRAIAQWIQDATPRRE